MYIEVGPARRPGSASTIYDQPLKNGDFQIDSNVGITLTIEASGMRDDKSRYRYKIHLAPDDVRELVAASE